MFAASTCPPAGFRDRSPCNLPPPYMQRNIASTLSAFLAAADRIVNQFAPISRRKDVARPGGQTSDNNRDFSAPVCASWIRFAGLSLIFDTKDTCGDLMGSNEAAARKRKLERFLGNGVMINQWLNFT
ncbi:hypothetical protein Trydic_g3558 [Trypoxylus dichotomus]